MSDRKIIIATGIFPPDIGGPATYSRLVAEEFSKQGESVVVVTYSDEEKSKIKNQKSKLQLKNEKYHIVKIYRNLPKGIIHIFYFLKVFLVAGKNSAIYAQDPISAGLPALIAAKLSGSKFILKVVGDYAWERYQNLKIKYQNDNVKFKNIEEFQYYQPKFFIYILKKLERWVAKSADSVVVPSEYLKKIVLRWGVEENKIKVIYNSYLEENFECKDDKNKNLIISVGRLVPWKGFDILIDIMLELLREDPNFVLHIIGEGPERETLELKVKDLGLEGKVFLKGKMSKSELFCALKNASIFVLNTSYEGLSHQLLEVMDAGIPIITTNIGGNPEIIKNGENGVLVAPDNKQALVENILTVYKDEDLKKILVENAKKTLEKFNYEKMMKETLDILNK